jgi:hypothetical protein
MSNEKLEEMKALMRKQGENKTSWANMANENDPIPMGPSSAPATYKAKTYLPDASKWAQKQATIEEEASAERAQTPNSLSESNLEDIRKSMYAYDNYTDRMGLPRRASRTPTPERRRRSYERRRTARRQSPRRRSPSPRRRSPSPVRRYGVGRRYVAAPGYGSRRRSPSPRRRSPSPRRRSPSPRYSRRRSPSPRYSRRRGSRNASPLRYTVANNGRTVNEFGRNVPGRGTAQGPRFNTRRQRRPVHVFDEKTKTYKPANWNV